MPPELLVPAVVIGLALVLGGCWAAGWSAEARITEGDAARAVAVDHPELSVVGVVVAVDGRAAVVSTSRGREGGDFLVVVVGAKLAVRDLARVTVGELPGGLRVVAGGPLGATPPLEVQLGGVRRG
jgi:hypothetical protein